MGTMKQLRLPVACALALMTVAPVEAQVKEIVLHNFQPATGMNPTTGVTLAPDGIYGTAPIGGTADYGVVYKWDTAHQYYKGAVQLHRRHASLVTRGPRLGR